MEALVRVDDFLTQHADAMGGAVRPSAREKFTALRHEVADHMRAQEGTRRLARTQTTVKQALRKELVEKHMRPISRMARSELRLSPRPAAFAMPALRMPYTTLVAVGYGMAEAAAPHRAALTAGGLADDFIERLISATDALRDAVSATSQVVATRVEATAMLGKHGQVARRYLSALDSVVRAAIEPDQALFDRWVNLSRVASAAVVEAVGEGARPQGQEGSGSATPAL
jgi:hypothetical protein